MAASAAQAAEQVALNAHITLRELKGMIDTVVEKKLPTFKTLMEMCTNSFNNPDEFVEMRSVLVEQGLMSENEFHRISLVAYMCNLDSENAWKYFSKENPLFGKFDKAENEGVFLTNEEEMMGIACNS